MHGTACLLPHRHMVVTCLSRPLNHHNLCSNFVVVSDACAPHSLALSHHRCPFMCIVTCMGCARRSCPAHVLSCTLCKAMPLAISSMTQPMLYARRCCSGCVGSRTSYLVQVLWRVRWGCSCSWADVCVAAMNRDAGWWLATVQRGRKHECRWID